MSSTYIITYSDSNGCGVVLRTSTYLLAEYAIAIYRDVAENFMGNHDIEYNIVSDEITVADTEEGVDSAILNQTSIIDDLLSDYIYGSKMNNPINEDIIVEILEEITKFFPHVNEDAPTTMYSLMWQYIYERVYGVNLHTGIQKQREKLNS